MTRKPDSVLVAMIYLCPRQYHQESERIHYGEGRWLQRGGLPLMTRLTVSSGLVSITTESTAFHFSG